MEAMTAHSPSACDTGKKARSLGYDSVFMIGTNNVGKTSILKQIANNKGEPTKPTKIFDWELVYLEEDFQAIVLCDAKGRAELRWET